MRTSSVRFRLPHQGIARPCGLTIGSFDGVHLGHQAIIRELVAQCRARDLRSSVLTFYPRPAQYFGGPSAAPSLMGRREKVGALLQLDLDQIICMKFDQALRELTAEAFIERVVVAGLNARLVMIGDDFRFGNDRRGDYRLLQEMAAHHGFALVRSPTLEQGGERISSSRIRAALAAGQLDSARALLGHDYAIQGRVVSGRQLGRQLGAPTANIELPRDRLAMTGVFVVRVQLSPDETRLGVANLGFRPAVDQRTEPVLEVHLLDFDENLYGRRLCVSFLQKIRDEQGFSSHQALEQQIRADIEWARRWLAQQTNELMTR